MFINSLIIKEKSLSALEVTGRTKADSVGRLAQ